jgi:DNA polymerase III delta subunit
MARTIGVPPFVLDKMAQPARRFHPGALAHAMRLLAQADRDLKGPPKQALGEDIILGRVVERIVSLAR